MTCSYMEMSVDIVEFVVVAITGQLVEEFHKISEYETCLERSVPSAACAHSDPLSAFEEVGQSFFFFFPVQVIHFVDFIPDSCFSRLFSPVDYFLSGIVEQLVKIIIAIYNSFLWISHYVFLLLSLLFFNMKENEYLKT